MIYYLSIWGVIVSIIAVLVLDWVTPMFKRWVRKKLNMMEWKEDEKSAKELFKDTKEIMDGEKYNKIRIRLLVLELLAYILLIICVFAPVFLIYFRVVEYDSFWWWLLYFIVINFVVNIVKKIIKIIKKKKG